ncbi:Histidinol-phosphate aminotransferase [hydrothermal vent metagenome]|uniref:Histidinol-phosphate aminotransferase n=1 Tax=hydrothermal vent metagenome TaxID=652676 RepID=A0A3B1ARP8_9ZZZZ
MSDQDQIARWVRPEIKELAAYHVPDPSGLIKLDAMENPFTWPDELRREWLELLHRVDVNRYPDPQGTELKLRLRNSMGIPADAGLLLGNGSDELIQMLALTLSGPDRVVLSVDPGFVMYRMIAVFAGMTYRGIPVHADDFSLDLPAMLKAIEQYQPAVIYLAYPNNPTGNLFGADEIRQVIETAPGLVVVDEAYAPFTDATFMSKVGCYPNLLVMRTLSKMGLAGLRLGLLVGPETWLNEIDKTRLPYNINTLTQVTAEFALRHESVFNDQTYLLRKERAWLFSALQGLDGVTPFPSEANFILVRMPFGRADEIHAALKAASVLVKNLHAAHPLLADCLRITVGQPEENLTLLQALSAAL